MNKYTKEGMDSFDLKTCLYLNPYSPGTDMFNLFERGWTQALKRTPSTIFSARCHNKRY